MSTVSRGFKGRRRPSVELPPGQSLVEDFPVLSAGPTRTSTLGTGSWSSPAWIAFGYDGQELEPKHGGAAAGAQLHLWKSAKWVRGIQLADQDEPGFWESLGYHNDGDPWQEQRFWGD